MSTRINHSEVTCEFLKSGEFSEILAEVIVSERKKLYEEIIKLKEEVTNLKASNIQLIHYPQLRNTASNSIENSLTDTETHGRPKNDVNKPCLNSVSGVKMGSMQTASIVNTMKSRNIHENKEPEVSFQEKTQTMEAMVTCGSNKDVGPGE
ncbi:hypothetical protein JTB14_004101 [Gonioctena quinquepunctata]|nr:hypothetical protein JTB14_004101 [Gonioctena quinquepunctata]